MPFSLLVLLATHQEEEVAVHVTVRGCCHFQVLAGEGDSVRLYLAFCCLAASSLVLQVCSVASNDVHIEKQNWCQLLPEGHDFPIHIKVAVKGGYLLGFFSPRQHLYSFPVEQNRLIAFSATLPRVSS